MMMKIYFGSSTKTIAKNRKKEQEKKKKRKKKFFTFDVDEFMMTIEQRQRLLNPNNSITQQRL